MRVALPFKNLNNFTDCAHVAQYKGIPELM
jgi:hypothetical protein